MTLSTSNSSSIGPRGNPIASVILFLMGFVVAGLLAMCVYLSSAQIQRGHELVKDFPKEIPSDHFIAHFMGSLEHDIYWFDFFNIIENVKRADVVIVGHSRMGRAFDSEVTSKFFAGHELNYYQLSMGHRDGFPFVMKLFERFVIKPKLLIVSANLFFENYESEVFRATQKKTKWEAQKEIKERVVGFHVARHLHHWIPHNREPVGLFSLVLRNINTGHWSSPQMGPARYPIVLEKDRNRLNEDKTVIGNSNKFYWWLKSRGGEMVLTWLPTSERQMFLGELDQISDELGKELLYVEDPNWETFDRSHLTPKSAVGWTKKFLKRFEQTPEFKALLTTKKSYQ